MPALGMQQDTGTLIAWLKDEGEPVAKWDPVMEIETDKITVEIEAPASGILGGICANEGDVVPVGQTVAWILAPGEPVPEGPRDSQGDQAPALREVVEVPQAGPTPAGAGRPEIGQDGRSQRWQTQPGDGAARLSPASPLARRLASERGLDVGDLIGTGPDGAVLAADLPPAEPALADVTATGADTIEPGTLWKVMATRVTQSWTNAPHFYLVREVNASRLVAWRDRVRDQVEPAPTYSDLLVKLVAAALGRHPGVNASWNEGSIVLHPEINIGLAAAVADGLVVPVIHRADEKSVRQIAARRQELVQRAQAGRLAAQDLANGTFTISNLGMYGVDAFNAIVNPPQAAILAVGRIAERVVPLDGRPALQPMMILSLSCDHRVLDGARGALFLDTVAGLIEEPFRLLE